MFENLQQLSIQYLRGAYRNGRLQVPAVIDELRQRALQDRHNAWIHVLTEAELSPYIKRLAALQPDSLPLYGIPFAVKDNIDVAGIVTSAACPDFAYKAAQSATVVARLVEAGAVPLGKTNLDQFATGLVGTRSPYGEAHNALQPDYISGGSSSGSAIATALGHVSFALGTDTAGSGRVPAAFNNLLGHKPSHGMISTHGVVPACRSIDCVSVMAATAQDVAAVLEQAIGFDPEDPFSRRNYHYNSALYFADVPGAFTFAVPDELDFDGDRHAEALFQQSVETLTGLGGTPHTIPFAGFYEAARLLYAGPWVAERRLATAAVDGRACLPVLLQVLQPTEENASSEAVFAAQYKLRALKQTCDGLIAPFDFVLTPTVPTVYTRRQVAAEPIQLNSRLGTYTNFMNLLDYAATAVPAGMLPCGTGWGVTLFSRHGSDYRLLSFAAALQQATGLPLGADKVNHGMAAPPAPAARFADLLPLAVCGAHLTGQPLNWQLTSRGATLLESTRTRPCYSLYALPDGKRPALIRGLGTAPEGAAVDVEVWLIPHDTLGSFVDGISEPLAIGKVELADGRWVNGFVCANGVPEGALDITRYGGWKQWLAWTAVEG